MSNQFLVEAIECEGTHVSIYRVPDGYRVQISGFGTQFYWHPGIFRCRQVLWDWLLPQLEALVEDGIPLGNEWMMLEGDFDDNSLYRDWFICKSAQSWQGYDPLTNRCYSAPSWLALRAKIDRVEEKRSTYLKEAELLDRHLETVGTERG